MPVFADGRIPVLVVSDADALAAALVERPGAALLGEGAAAPDGALASAGIEAAGPHPIACTCCAGRGGEAVALDRLFLDRVRGRVPWFERVVALIPEEAQRASLRAVLRDDAVVSSRFRPG